MLSVVCLFQSDHTLAQFQGSTIRGTATDETGGVIPGVEITVIDLSTNLSRSTVTDELGNYEMPDLKKGTYRLDAKLPGFKSFIADNLILESAEVRRIDVRLQVGEVTEEVTVNADAAVIEREESKLAAAVGNVEYEDAPLVSLSRFNPNMMLQMMPGVQPPQNGFDMTVAGMKGGNNITEGMDGAQTDGVVNQIHNMEDVAELKVVTTNNTADVGRAAYFNLVSKRGSDDFHGNAFYYHMNRALNARPFFASTNPPFLMHIFGASQGGRIIKDKTFFYVSYNAMKDPSKNWVQQTVPTAKMRVGDFSELSKAIIDPLTGEAFSNNQIPPERFNSVSSRTQEQYMPAPNRGGTTNNFEFLHKYPYDLYRVDYFAVRIDHRISENNDFFGRWSNRWTPYVLARAYPQMEWTRNRYAWQMTYTDTHIFSPTLVNTARFGWYLNKVDDGKEVDGFTPLKGNEVVSSIGLQGVNPNGISEMGFPQMNITGYAALDNRAGGKIQDENEVSYADMVTWTMGRHTWKFGGELRTFGNTTAVASTGTYGQFWFDGRFTGNAYADFLLGYPNRSSRLSPLFDRLQRSSELSFYATDTFKVSPKLTLDLGLRWDYFGAASYQDNLQYNWDPVSGNVVVPSESLSLIDPLYPTDTINVVAGDVLVNPTKGNFAPRLGFAYRLNEETVLRGGYGLFTEFWGHYPYAYGTGPFELSQLFFNQMVDGQPLFSFPDPFPEAEANIPSQSVSGYPIDGNNGYVQQFNLSLEREVADIGLRVSYQGTRARGLNYGLNINKPQPSTIPFSADRRPWPQFVSGSFTRTGGAVNYDALVLRAVKKVGGVTFDAHYTWAHNMSNTQNLENPYADLFWDREYMVPNHRAVFNIHWNLPVGRGERYLPDVPAVVNGILGNWKVSFNGALATGQFFSPSFSGSDPSNTNSFGGTPDRVADGNYPSDRRDINDWFDTSAFTVPESGRFGNAGKNILEGPGRGVLNMSVLKNFYVSEDFRVQFNVAFGNLFNRPNFAFPRSNISASAPGVVTETVGLWNLQNADARKIELRLRLKW